MFFVWIASWENPKVSREAVEEIRVLPLPESKARFPDAQAYVTYKNNWDVLHFRRLGTGETSVSVTCEVMSDLWLMN
jgi:hypothetical protein